MASEEIMQKMRMLLGHTSRHKQRTVMLWLAAGLLIFSLVYLHWQQESFEWQTLPQPAEDPVTRSPISLVPSEIANLPLVYLKDPYLNELYGRRRCGHYPPLWELKFNNKYWQLLEGDQATFYFYSAFYDIRRLGPSSPSLRILGMIDKYNVTNFKLFCQMWFEGVRAPVITKIRDYNYIGNPDDVSTEDGVLQPFLMRCHIPEQFYHLIPVSVSLSELPCKKSYNNIRVIYNPPVHEERENIAICMKTLDFAQPFDVSRLVEWLELVFLLGADKVYMNSYGSYPLYTRVLDYYKAKGLLDVQDTSLPGTQPAMPKVVQLYNQMKSKMWYQNELIPLNDCFYRNLYQYKFITLLDISEMIIPKTFDTWVSLLKNITPETFDGNEPDYSFYYFRNIHFKDDHGTGWIKDLPAYMYLLKHIHRAPEYTTSNASVTGFYTPQHVLTLQYHVPISCLRPEDCDTLLVNVSAGHLQQYRRECLSDMDSNCEYFNTNLVLDTTIWKYMDALTRNTDRVLKELGYLISNHKRV